MSQMLSSRVKVSVYYDGKLYHKNLPLDVPVLDVAVALTNSIIPFSHSQTGFPVLSRLEGARLSDDLSLRAENIVDNDILVLTLENGTHPFVDIVEELSIPIGLLCEKEVPKFSAVNAKRLMVLVFNALIFISSVTTYWWWCATSFSGEARVFSGLIVTVAVIAGLVSLLFRGTRANGDMCFTPIIAVCLCAVQYQHTMCSWEQSIVFFATAVSLLGLWLIVYRKYYVPIVTVLLLLVVGLLVSVVEDVTQCKLQYVWLVMLTLSLLYPCVDYYSSVVAGVKIPKLFTPDSWRLVPESEITAYYTTKLDFFTEENKSVFTFTHRIIAINKITLITFGVLMYISTVGLLCTTHKTATNWAVCLVSCWLITRFPTGNTRFKAVFCITLGFVMLVTQFMVIVVTQPETRFPIAILLLMLPLLVIVATGVGVWASSRDVPRVIGILSFVHYLIILVIIPLLLLSVNAYSIVRGM